MTTKERFYAPFLHFLAKEICVRFEAQKEIKKNKIFG